MDSIFLWIVLKHGKEEKSIINGHFADNLALTYTLAPAYQMQ